MFNRIPYEGIEHDQLITVLANRLESDGFYVKADHIGHPNGTPAQIIHHIPDIVAAKDNRKIFVEAETESSISSQDTYNQWKEFSGIYGAEFHVIVPQGSLQRRKTRQHYGV